MPLTNLLNDLRANANNGKQRSELTATRDPFTGQTRILPEEEMEAFQTFVQSLAGDLEPVGAVERQLAHSYATFQWRINRAAAVEDTMFTFGNMEQIADNLNIQHAQAHNAASQAKTFRERSDDFARIGMFSQRLVNQSEIVLKRLQKLQADRRQRDEAQLLEAAKLYRLQQLVNQPFDPKALGYAFPLAEIQSASRRELLKQEVHVAEKLLWHAESVRSHYSKAAA